MPDRAALDPGRLATLTDGIFAIAMTLLVLNLQVPRIPENQVGSKLPHELFTLWPKVLGFVLSFVVVGVYWVGHHNQFHYIRRLDRTFIWINIGFLLFVAFVPFTAAVLGEYVHQQIAVAIYGLNLVAVGAMLYVVWRYATTSHRLVDEDLSPLVIRVGGQRTLVGVGVYLLAVIVSFISTWLSVVLYILVPVLYILPGRIDRNFRQPPAPSGSHVES